MKKIILYIVLFSLFTIITYGFAGGDGSVGNPYQISDCTQLQAMKDTILNAHYILINNIDCSDTVNWNSGAGFKPVGVDQHARFAGTFNGQGYVITGLYINRPNNNVGLFAYTHSTTTISNVGLESADIKGNDHVGGLVGYNYMGTISDSYVTGSVASSSPYGNYIGGLVGTNLAGTIINSHTTGTVTGNTEIGGLVADNLYGTITESFSTARVIGLHKAGGLVGYNYHGPITDSYATGDVSVGGGYSAGGLTANNYGTITNSYATGDVLGGRTGGLAHYNDNAGIIINSYATGNVFGSTLRGGLVAFNSGAVTNSYFTDSVNNNGIGILEPLGAIAFYGNSHSVYAGSPVWDFTNVWGARPADYPILAWGVVDTDGDGIPDDEDNCPNVANTDQADLDGDLQGDVCDSDDDGDGVPDISDNSPTVPNPGQEDTDGDGEGDASDSDDDGDGVPDESDSCPLIVNTDQTDTDGDGLGNACDPDDDNDGVLDVNDGCPLVSALGLDANDDGCIDDFDGLQGVIDSMSDGILSSTVKTSLISKINTATSQATRENICAAINILEAFKNQISAQSGNKISTEAADLLIAYANNIIAQLEADLAPGETC